MTRQTDTRVEYQVTTTSVSGYTMPDFFRTEDKALERVAYVNAGGAARFGVVRATYDGPVERLLDF